MLSRIALAACCCEEDELPPPPHTQTNELGIINITFDQRITVTVEDT